MLYGSIYGYVTNKYLIFVTYLSTCYKMVFGH